MNYTQCYVANTNHIMATKFRATQRRIVYKKGDYCKCIKLFYNCTGHFVFCFGLYMPQLSDLKVFIFVLYSSYTRRYQRIEQDPMTTVQIRLWFWAETPALRSTRTNTNWRNGLQKCLYFFQDIIDNNFGYTCIYVFVKGQDCT